MELSIAQFELVSNMFSFTVAAMGATALFSFFAASQIKPRYRIAVYVSAVVVSIACYHYFRIDESWHDGYVLTGPESTATYVETNTPFNHAYRYADWILTVPLLMVELVAVLALAKAQSISLLKRLVTAAVAMIALGYPGEVSQDVTTRWIFWGLSMVPFLYLLYILLTELTRSLERQPSEVRGWISAARWLVIVSWSFYPLAFLSTTIFPGNASAEVALQVGYTIADVVAKALFGLFIYLIAARKSQIESESVEVSPAFASATS